VNLAVGKQWGITDLGMEAIKNLKMVEAARDEAKKLVGEDKLDEKILKKIENKKEIHFE
jgi:hypothetical protein